MSKTARRGTERRQRQTQSIERVMVGRDGHAIDNGS